MSAVAPNAFETNPSTEKTANGEPVRPQKSKVKNKPAIDPPPLTERWVRRKLKHPLLQPAPLRVGFVVHVMQVAGAEVLVRETIKQLGSQIEPTIFCLDSLGRIGEELQAQGVPIVVLNRKGRDFGVAWRMAQEIRTRRIEVIHAHQYTPFFYAALAKIPARFSFKLIMTEHGRHYPDVVSPLRRSVNRLFLDPLADAVNACCEFSGKALSKVDGFSGRRIEVIDNGVELHRYTVTPDKKSLREKLGWDPSKIYITKVARFHEVKDHPMLIRAFAEVAQQRPNVDLLLAGEGPSRTDLENLATELGVRDRVKFLGVRSDVPQVLQASDIFALTSVSEAASLTLLEAMACGLPVVVTDVGGNPELARQGIDGFLVPRGDSRSCAQALLRLVDDPELRNRLGQNGRQRVEDRFTLAKTIQEYSRLYHVLAGR